MDRSSHAKRLARHEWGTGSRLIPPQMRTWLEVGVLAGKAKR